MFLILASYTSIMTVVGWIWVIRVITRGRFWWVIFSVLTTLLLLFTSLSFTSWVWRWWRIWQMRWWRIRVWVHFWSVLFALWCWTMLWSNHFYSSRNIIKNFTLLDFFIFCLSIWVILSRVSISLIFSRSLCSRSNIFIVSKSNSLRYFLNANFSLMFLVSSWVAAAPMLLGWASRSRPCPLSW